MFQFPLIENAAKNLITSCKLMNFKILNAWGLGNERHKLENVSFATR